MEKVKMYKGWIIAQEEDTFYVFDMEEWGYGKGCRSPEFECGSIQECIDNINSY